MVVLRCGIGGRGHLLLAALASLGHIGPAPAASPASAPAVRVDLTGAQRADLAIGDPLRMRVSVGRGGGARLRSELRFHGGRRFPLGRTRKLSLRPHAWRELTVPIGHRPRSLLARCSAARIVVTVTGARIHGSRSFTAQAPLPAPACGRFFRGGAFWNSALGPGAPVDSDSGAVTDQLLRRVRSGAPPTINTTAYTPPVYTVGARQRRVAVHLDRAPGYNPDLSAALASVPLPVNARPAAGSDHELVVWQPATDTLWELWLAHREADGWHASWGGRLDHVSTGPGVFRPPHANWGTSASSLPLVGGLITPRELRTGRIDHALSMGVPGVRAGVFALPAQRTDGASSCVHAPPEGARFRLDPRLPIDQLGLPRPVAILAHAAQRYGIIVREQSGAVVLYAQNASPLGTDPYPALFGGRSASELLTRFPWQHLQLTPMSLVVTSGATAQFGQLPGPLNGCA